MNTIQRIGAAVLAAMMVLSVLTAATGSVAAAADPSITVTNAPSSVSPDGTFQIEYEIENTGTLEGAFTVETPNLPSNVTVDSIEGDIQSRDLDSTPPSASTDAAQADGDTVNVTVTYNASGMATGDTNFEFTASSPIDGTSDSQSTTITVQESVAVPNISATGGDDVARQGSAYESTYTIENTGTAPGSFTVRTQNLSSGITINSIEGDVQSANVNGTPPSATTDSASAGSSVAVTVNYSVASDTQLGSYSLFTLAAEEPIAGTTDNTSANVTVKQPAPEESTDRALEVSGKDNASEVEQNDVTVTITRFDRGQSVNGIKVSQNDVTVLITLFERNN